MKKLTYLMFIVSSTCFGQTNCDHNVTTNYLNPVNQALPIGSDASKYLNGFNWFPVTGSGLYDDYACTNISFAGVPYSEMNNILINSLPYYDYIADGPLPLGINGWELLLVNVGRFPNDITPITAGNSNYSIPYIVLYNRYAGIIRVFVNYGLDKDLTDYPDAMEIQLSFHAELKLSGLLRLNEGMDQALEENTKVNKIAVIVKAPAQMQQWASTDIRIAYDPCTCYFPSDLRLDFKQVKHSTLELHGRSITLSDETLINNTTLQVNPAEYLTGFDYTGGTVNGGGMLMHKAMQSLIDDYLTKYSEYNDKLVAVGEHNKTVKRNLSVLKAVKYVVGIVAASPLGLIPTNDLLAEMAAEEAYNESNGMSTEAITIAYEGLGVNDTDWFKVIENMQAAYVKIDAAGNKILNTEDLFKKATQIFGEKAKTFIANNFVEQNPPAPPSAPTATFTEMHYSGDISNSVDIGGFKFFSPGSYGSTGTGTPVVTSVYEYPVYNEVLGTFALLNSPKINISKTIATGNEHVLSQNTIGLSSAVNAYKIQTHRYRTWTKEYQIELASDLKYALNSVLDIKKYEIQASFEIVAKPKLLQTVPLYTILHSFQDPSIDINVTSNNADIAVFSPITNSLESYHNHYNNPDFNGYWDNFLYGYPNEGVPLNEIEISKETVMFQTAYLPINAFQPLIAGFGIKNELNAYNEQLIPIATVDQYDVLWNNACNCYLADLNDLNIEKPNDISQSLGGYEHDLEIELKLIVDIEFNTVNEFGVTNKVTQLLTYKIKPENINWLSSSVPIVPNLATTTDNIGQYPQNINFSTTDFHGQTVQGCELVGTEYTCQAWNNITISGNLSTSNGFKAYIKAGNEINVVDESVISPETVLMINPILDYSHPMPMADGIYVQQFCQGTLGGNAPSYHANSSGKTPQDVLIAEQLNEQKEFDHSIFDFNLYPNPTELFTTVKLTGSEPVNIQLFDITGKEIQFELVRLDSNLYKLNMPNCEKGIYLVKVTSLTGTQTKQLILQ